MLMNKDDQDAGAAGTGLVTDLVFNAVIDWLSPVEYEGRAQLTLPPGDPRLRLSALLAWEAGNALQFITNAMTPLRAVFSSNSTRDKFIRLIQYALTVVLGTTALLRPEKRKEWLYRALRKLRYNISTARRTFRFLELGPFLALANSGRLIREGEPFWPARLVSLASIATFSVLDRKRLLQEHNFFHGDATSTAIRAMRFICVAHAASCLRQLLRVLWCEAGTARAELRSRLRDALKQAFCLLQAAHIGRVPYLETHDVVVGLAGMATTADDLRAIWHASS